jgi:hypothetical protein
MFDSKQNGYKVTMLKNGLRIFDFVNALSVEEAESFMIWKRGSKNFSILTIEMIKTAEERNTELNDWASKKSFA